jgi:DNA-binding transcriptional regulator YhcF (GntR family)
MNWNINKSIPICPQIYERLCVAIANKELAPKNKISSVRELALLLSVNPNTVQKSYDSLEKKGVIYSVRGSGWFVSENVDIALDIVKEVFLKKTFEYLKDMENLGYDKEAVIAYLNNEDGGMKNE